MPVRVRLRRVVLLSAMALATLNVFTGSPLLALWIGSRLQGTSTSPSMLPIAIVAVVMFATSILLVRAMAQLSSVYDRMLGRPPARRGHSAWLRSLTSERPEWEQGKIRSEGVTALERILVVSFIAVVIAFEIWFFFYSPSPI